MKRFKCQDYFSMFHFQKKTFLAGCSLESVVGIYHQVLLSLTLT